MSERKIKVVIDPLGRAKVEAIGFAGEGCVEATAKIEQVLAGGGPVTKEFKDEWLQGGEQTNAQEQTSW